MWWSTSYATGPMRFLHAGGAPWCRAAYLLAERAIRLPEALLELGRDPVAQHVCHLQDLAMA